jgi:membrane protein insertase Oxa1/YidC/SpoIIIJ
MLVPLDFANRYFTRKNSKSMERFKPEVDAIKEQLAGDPIAINKATREVYRKNGHKMGGFCAFSIINLTLTLIIFMTVFYSLRAVADYNIHAQFKNHLQPIYQKYNTLSKTEYLLDEDGNPNIALIEFEGLSVTQYLLDEDGNLKKENAFHQAEFYGILANPKFEEAFKTDVLTAFNNSRIGFLWVTNIWKQDHWTPKTHDFGGFFTATNKVEGSIFHISNYQDRIDDRYEENDYMADDKFKSFISEKNKKTFGLNRSGKPRNKLGYWRDWSTWEQVPPAVQTQIHNSYMSNITTASWVEYRDEIATQYNAMFSDDIIRGTQRGWNGMLFLIILAGVVTYFSTVITMKLMTSGKKKEDPAKPKEIKAQYSMRNVKNQTDGPTKPTIDPAKMTKIMKFALPVVMIFFTLISTAALAIYIIASSAFATMLTIAMKYPVNKLLEWQDKRATARGDAPPATDTEQPVINPHAKYFRRSLGRKHK